MTEEERKKRQADQAARTMFNVFPQGTGEAIRGAISPAVQGITNAFTNITSGPLIRSGGPQPAERPTPSTTVLPSGTPMIGFDSYPTRPSISPSAPTSFPYGSALGPSIYTQTPTQTNLQTGMGGSIPTPSGFSTINPPAFPVQRESVSRLGLMGGVLPSGQVGPLPMNQITPMTAGQRPIIESGPVRMGISATQTPEQRGLNPIQTPYGTIYATREQQANLQEPRTLAQQSSRSPAEQQALLAQMRERGADIRERIASTAMNSLEGRQPSRLYTTPIGAAIAAPTNMFGQPIPEFQQRYAQREDRLMGQPVSSVAALGANGFGAMQRQQESMIPPPIRTPSLFGGMGYASTFGGPQPEQAIGQTTTPQDFTRSQLRELAGSAGVQTTQRSWSNYISPEIARKILKNG